MPQTLFGEGQLVFLNFMLIESVFSSV